jgi:hypothetical protein
METNKTNQIVNVEAPSSPVATTTVVTGGRIGRPKTKEHLVRCILSNGVPVGRGRPSKSELEATRTVVYLKKGEQYSPSLGIGEPLDKRKHKPLKVIPLKTV